MFALLALALAAAGPDGEVQVPVLDHAVQKGDRLETGDFAVEARPAATARGALAVDEAVGMEAVRNLAAGAVVRRGDVARPQLVRRGEPVTIRIVSGSLVITASGRALSGGGLGDAVRIVTTATSRTLDGKVEGSGTVRVVTP